VTPLESFLGARRTSASQSAGCQAICRPHFVIFPLIFEICSAVNEKRKKSLTALEVRNITFPFKA
jgi:hypothetical protein